MSGPQSLQDALKTLPADPGVYLFLDAKGGVLYIGKAKNLKKRVRSYFQRSAGDGRVHFHSIVEETADCRVIVTANEKEALLLEHTLIGEHRPRYNVDWRDDKSYLSLRLTAKETFPRLHPVRKVRRDGARYFGPFSSAAALRETLNLMRSRFPLRTCRPANFRNRTRPCLRFEMGHCAGPCCGRIDEAAYGRIVREAVLLLEGRIPQLKAELRRRMEEEAEGLRFEEAARLRDVLRALEKTTTPQEVVSLGGEDRDAFGLYREGSDLAVAVLFVREGKVVGSESRTPAGFPTDEEALATAVLTLYGTERVAPPEILLPVPLPDASPLEEILGERRGKRVHLRVPARGHGRALVAMAGRNAAQALARSDRSRRKAAEGMEDLRRRLRLPALPRRIECFDASHVAGSFAVGAMAVLADGRPDPRSYRMYKIRDATAAGDDYAMMREIVLRRFAPGKEASPDLLLIDGGPGQLGAVLAALRGTEREPFPVAALAKERGGGGERDRNRPERIHLPGRGQPIVLPPDAPALRLLVAARDEAHRFAVGYHRKLRLARNLRSGLEEVPGVGPRRRAALLKRFGSLKAVKEATADQIAEVPGISLSLAQTILDVLRGGEAGGSV